MNARVRAPRDGRIGGDAQRGGDCAGELPLDRAQTGLSRPAREVRSVVLQNELDRRHAQELERAVDALLYELDIDHLRGVGPPRAEFEDARVATRAFAVSRGDLLEKLVDRELVLVESGKSLSPRVQVTTLGKRYQLLDLGLDHLGLRLRG